MKELDTQIIERAIELKCQEFLRKGFVLGTGRHTENSNVRCALETFAPYNLNSQKHLSISHAQKVLKLSALQIALIAEGFDGLRFMMANQKLKKYWKIGDRLRRKFIEKRKKR